MSIIITVSNQKGGVGKTTTSAAICAGLADRGAKVFGIDLDPQGNLGFCMGLEGSNPTTILDALQGKVRGAAGDSSAEEMRYFTLRHFSFHHRTGKAGSRKAGSGFEGNAATPDGLL